MNGDPLDLDALRHRFYTNPDLLTVDELDALVEIARAARALIADREGANIGEERLALRDALARLDGMEPGKKLRG